MSKIDQLSTSDTGTLDQTPSAEAPIGQHALDIASQCLEAIDPTDTWIPMESDQARQWLNQAYEKGVSYSDIEAHHTYGTPIPPAYAKTEKYKEN